jgi:hypothetical protein
MMDFFWAEQDTVKTPMSFISIRFFVLWLKQATSSAFPGQKISAMKQRVTFLFTMFTFLFTI